MAVRHCDQAHWAEGFLVEHGVFNACGYIRSVRRVSNVV